MPAPVPRRKPRVPAQRRVPIEAGGGEARLAAGELMRRTKVRSVESEGAILRLGGMGGCDKGRQSDCLGRK